MTIFVIGGTGLANASGTYLNLNANSLKQVSEHNSTGQEREWRQYSLAGYRKAHTEESSKTDDQILPAIL
ncbi:hypothetical protein NKJ59_04890 [Mesorhizobium australicum]|uniref:hypothetical protein n=1 Tax=Mesorhizobium australicum TaxID=536018 RepID=UPI003334BB62